jgi:hypothetical protein
MFVWSDGKSPPFDMQPFWVLLGIVVIAHLAGRFKVWKKLSDVLPSPAIGASYALVLIASQLLAPGVPATFIYFQF